MPTPFISSDNTYVIYYTNTLKGTISIPQNTIITNILDVALIGKTKLEYGNVFDENVLHLLENFASFQNPNPSIPNTVQPDLSQIISPLLQQPTEGQFWYNKGYFIANVQKGNPGLYVFTILPSNATIWKPITLRSDIAGNSGIIAHGQQIPLPAGISEYSQCSIFVSPQYLDVESNYVVCYSDVNGNVFVRYRPDDQNGVLVDGLANYIILGNATVTTNTYKPVVSVTPTLTPAPPPGTPTRTPTPSVTGTPIPAASVTPTPSVTVTPSSTPAPSITPTPTVTRTTTPAPSVTPSPSRIVAQTFTLNAVQHNYSPGLNYITFGAFRSTDNSINFGTINSASPPLIITLNGRQYYVDGIESYSDIYITPQLGFYIRSVDGLPISSTPYPFSRVQFTDQFGILRSYSPTDPTVVTAASPAELARGQMSTAWHVPAVLFTSSNYIISVFP